MKLKVYRNLWAGYPTWFVETSHTRDRRNGFEFLLCKDGVHFEKQVSYYNASFSESPDRYPLVGEISLEELFDFFRSRCKNLDEETIGKLEVKEEN